MNNRAYLWFYIVLSEWCVCRMCWMQDRTWTDVKDTAKRSFCGQLDSMFMGSLSGKFIPYSHETTRSTRWNTLIGSQASQAMRMATGIASVFGRRKISAGMSCVAGRKPALFANCTKIDVSDVFWRRLEQWHEISAHNLSYATFSCCQKPLNRLLDVKYCFKLSAHERNCVNCPKSC